MGLLQPPLGSQVQDSLLWTLHTKPSKGPVGSEWHPAGELSLYQPRNPLYTKQGIEVARQGTSEHQSRGKEEGMM